MTTVNLYRYVNEDGSVTITPVKRSESDEPSRYRIIAEEGMILFKGELMTYCADIEIDDLSNWTEIEDPTPPDPLE